MLHRHKNILLFETSNVLCISCFYPWLFNLTTKIRISYDSCMLLWEYLKYSITHSHTNDWNIPVFTPQNWNIFRCTHKKWYPSGPLSFGVSPFEQEKKLHPVSQLYEVIVMTNTNMQFGISCLTAVVSPVQSKNMDLFFRQRIALGQLVLTCLPLYLILIEVITNELV